ncbi:alpha/beta fold hydrolase [Variovorax paradoxus]|uniref:alpha/beta fold hydrolase n=1 Tax=Variovorax paradoxus TaxID=34073 RepID=UPI00278870FD|nr:alpha/beta hydrolase [Variovorax paradoxus]MDQ0586057.1 pimeloyl-ACP methyl ester carboxylesterase [Variovorax paradoxus]
MVLHGTPFSSAEWRRIAPCLARERRVFYFDMRGYGLSDKPDADVSRGVQNEIFAALYLHWGLGSPDVVAHDFGGSNALRGHLLDGLDYRSLVLVDPVAISPQGSPLVQAARKHEEVFASLPAYIHEAMLRAYIGTAVGNALREDEMQLYPWCRKMHPRPSWLRPCGCGLRSMAECRSGASLNRHMSGVTQGSQQPQSPGESNEGPRGSGHAARLGDLGETLFRDASHRCHLPYGLPCPRFDGCELRLDQASGQKHRDLPDFLRIGDADRQLHPLQPQQKEEWHSVLQWPAREDVSNDQSF